MGAQDDDPDPGWVINGEDPDPDGHRYTLSPKADSPDIDFTPRVQPRYTGIYRIEGDTLTHCFCRAGNPRPSRFESPAGARDELYVLKRDAKK